MKFRPMRPAQARAGANPLFAAPEAWRTPAAILAGALALSLAALANGKPILLSDTDVYFYAGHIVFDAIAQALDPAHFQPPPAGAAQHAALIVGARSPFFGMAIFAIEKVGTLWALVAAQALAASATIWVSIRALAIARPLRAFALTIAALTIGSSLPMFVAFLMPDIYAGLGILGFALTIAAPEHFRTKGARVALAAFLVFVMLAHMSHLLTALAMIAAAAAALYRGPFRAQTWPRLRLPVIATAFAAALAILAAGLAKLETYPARSPPFLTARVLADGPGRAALPEICAKTDYAICWFSDRPLVDSSEILWSGDWRLGVFSVSNYETRVRLSEEDFRFAADVFLHRPFSTTGAALRNGALQFLAIGVDPEFEVDAARWRDLPPGAYLTGAQARIGACPPKGPCPQFLPYEAMAGLQILVLALSFTYLGARLTQAPFRPAKAEASAPPVAAGEPDPRAFTLFVLIVAAGLIANAALCGALSGVFPRYQARVIWLIPALALFLAFRHPSPWPSQPRPDPR